MLRRKKNTPEPTPPDKQTERAHERHEAKGLVTPLGNVIDISEGGLCVECYAKPALRRGQKVPLVISSGRQRLSVEGKVRWIRELGPTTFRFGIRFANTADEKSIKALLTPDAPSSSGPAAKPIASVEVEDLYYLLGVTSYASQDQIRHAYRTLVLKLHPDVGGQDTQDLFIQINKAYSVLRDPAARKRYDEMVSRLNKAG